MVSCKYHSSISALYQTGDEIIKGDWSASGVRLTFVVYSRWTNFVKVAPLLWVPICFKSLLCAVHRWKNLIYVKTVVYCDENYIKHKQGSLTGGKCFRENIIHHHHWHYWYCAQNKKSTSQHTQQSNKQKKSSTHCTNSIHTLTHCIIIPSQKIKAVLLTKWT